MTLVVEPGNAQFTVGCLQNCGIFACNHLLHWTIEDLNETRLVVGCPVPERSEFVGTRGPHTPICLQHHCVSKSCGHGLHATSDDLPEFFSQPLLPILARTTLPIPELAIAV